MNDRKFSGENLDLSVSESGFRRRFVKKLILIATVAALAVINVFGQDEDAPQKYGPTGKFQVVFKTQSNVKTSSDTRIKSLETYRTLTFQQSEEGFQAASILQRIIFQSGNDGSFGTHNAFSYDSNSEEDRKVEPGVGLSNFTKMIGQTTTLKLDKEGSVIEESIVFPNNNIGSDTNPMYTGNDNPLAAFPMFSSGVPDLNEGVSFTDKRDNGEASHTITYTVKSLDENTAVLSFTGSGKGQVFSLGLYGDYTVSGEMSLNVETGLVTNKTENIKGKGTNDLLGEFSIETTTVITVTPA